MRVIALGAGDAGSIPASGNYAGVA
jgi:hypothetical protein